MQARGIWLLLVAAILAAPMVAGCGGAPPGAGRETAGAASDTQVKPNVLLIEICSLRQDHVGALGYDRPTTPTIDSIAARGTLFRRCISPSSWTKPSTASILTGLSPGVHQLVDGAT